MYQTLPVNQSFLRKTTVDAIKNKVIVRGHLITDEMRYLITFSVNTFIRPSDMKTLKVGEITVASQGKTKYLRIMKATKTSRNKPYISMPDAVGIFEDLQKLNRAKGFAKPEDYLFFPYIPNRALAIQTMRRQFDWLLNKAKMKKSPSGINKTLYSLRHTALHFRLINSEGLDMITLSNSAVTSVDMLQRFYLAGANVEMNIDKLHSMKSKKTQTK